jgi:predicted dehydrogenase
MTLSIGIVGTGKIARMHAQAIGMSDAAALAAVSSRRHATAESFTSEFGGAPVEGVDALLNRSDVQAVYIAAPTSAKEAIALAAIAAGRHVLVEKPLASATSARRIAEAAKQASVAVIDATHFTHNPRTETIRQRMAKDIGAPITITSTFQIGLEDQDNIRFDPALEPQGALGDLGWYCARALIEFAPMRGPLTKARAVGTWEGDALIGCGALLQFESGLRSAFDCSFGAGSFVQDLTIAGDRGILSMDDFVHDAEKGHLLAPHPEIPSGYFLRQGRATRKQQDYIETPSPDSHVLRLLKSFAYLAEAPTSPEAEAARQRMVETQELLDAVWNEALAAR